MAISVTVTSTKIDVTATDVAGNTINDIYVAVAASAYPALMTRTGASSPYTYSISAQTELELSSGVYIKDYTSGGGILQWNSRTANSTAIFDVASGSKLELGEDWTIDFNQNGTQYTYVYAHGTIILQGTESNPVTLKHYYIFYVGSNSTTEYWDWDWVNCEDMNYGSGYWLYFNTSHQNEQPKHSFKNVTFSNPGGSPYTNRGRFYFNGIADFSMIELDNLTFDGCTRFCSCTGSSFKITNSTIKNCSSYPIDSQGGGGSKQYFKIGSGDDYNKYTDQQPKITFDNCLFSDNYGASEYTAGLFYGCTVKFKDCTFDETGSPPATYGVMSYGSSACLFEGTTDMTNVTNKYYHGSGGGSHFDCKTITLKVTDEGGTPIENAIVTFIEESERYIETMKTRDSGYIKDLFGDNPVLPYREITNNTGTTFINWDTYTITVSAPGYNIDTRTGIDMTSDKNIVVALTTGSSTATIIYDSTLYDSTIY